MHLPAQRGGKKSKPKSANSKSVAEVVPGLGRHLELRQRAKQMEDEARARKAKVFLEDAVKKDVAHRQTVPKQPRISAYAEHGAKAEERKRGYSRRRRRGTRRSARSGR